MGKKMEFGCKDTLSDGENTSAQCDVSVTEVESTMMGGIFVPASRKLLLAFDQRSPKKFYQLVAVRRRVTLSATP